MGQLDRTNWAGNVRYGARRVARPASVAELRRLLSEGDAATGPARAFGTGHSFNRLADTTGTAISLTGLPRRFELDAERATVTIDAGWRYGELGVALHAEGLALANLASLPHVSVVGACATATHGSGDRHRVLAASVRAVELVTADGALVQLERGRDDAFPAAAVSLGLLGVVVAVTLDVEPTYEVAQTVHRRVPMGSAVERFHEIMASGDSVSLFTRWRGAAIEQLWRKVRVEHDTPGAPVPSGGTAEPRTVDPPTVGFGAVPAAEPRHPIAGGDAARCTEQLGVPGPWHERWPHLRLEHEPSHGDELQSEFFVDRADGPAALVALARLGPMFNQVLHVSEVRSVAADDLWLSPAFARDVIAFHFTWKNEPGAVDRAVELVQGTLEPFSPRPHWAKLSTLAAPVLRRRFDGIARFAEVRGRFDPEGRFLNEHLRPLFA